ncbi:PelD GGDEF domain-containing protein [Glaciimonas sp. PCH181]|uniref:PelD GGDEF domain-containing protein n=1 Tax=Glaciimonas sp. PCH181 TaxID=2133943 RepID=UPI000D372E09|nr:PelD GGDEF domain-containing protein [Glaciimonas sp. PCH181]PUA17488.1 sugar ABC transporter [Glaciimonas sp. PCH181]
MNAPQYKPVLPQTPEASNDPDLLSPHQEHTGYLRGIKTPSRYSRLLAPGITGVGAIVESAALMLIALGLGYAFSPEDPLLLRLSFPYAWILPLILALRYGSMMGVLSGLVVVAGWLFLYAGFGPIPSVASPLFPRDFFIGGFLLVFIAGQYGDIWAVRLARSNVVNGYLSDRLSALTKNHFLLRLSHERLENDLLAKPTTLRDTLSQLRDVVLADSDHTVDLPSAAQLVQLAAHACQLETAALYVVNNGRVGTVASGKVGQPFPLNHDDPLFKMCLDKKTLVHLQSAELQDDQKTHYVACVPVLSGTDDLIGILVVKRMPFLSLNYENLQFLLVLMGYYADGARHAQATRQILKMVPDCPQDFALDYVRLARLQKETGVESHILALRFGEHDMQEILSTHVTRGLRSLDMAWPLQIGKSTVLIILIPLSGANAVSGYLLRVEEGMRANFGADFGQAKVTVQSMRVGAENGEDALQHLVTRMQIHG